MDPTILILISSILISLIVIRWYCSTFDEEATLVTHDPRQYAGFNQGSETPKWPTQTEYPAIELGLFKQPLK